MNARLLIDAILQQIDGAGRAARHERRPSRSPRAHRERSVSRSLWNAVYRFLQENGVVTRDEVVRRFPRDDEAIIRGMLRDLTESGLVFVTGTGAQTCTGGSR